MTIPLHSRICALVFLTSMLGNSPAIAQRDLREIPVPDAELERQTFRVPEGFEVNLFAADPAIAKPVQMNFDGAGRLWIASSEVYPHIAPGNPASDRVVVVEDTDHDGTADKTHVFAEGLLIPTGVVPGDGGAYVANSTELLHFADTDGDLKADSNRVVLSGFGTEDTHHILHTLRWGPDGFLYFNQSIYIHSHIETPWGVRRLNAGGIWQFRPETLELGVFMRGLVNSWGHHFDRFGQSFATDGAGGEGINYIVPGAYFATAANAPRLLQGLNPGSPKHCGLEIVETPMLPADWQGNAITNDFRGHRVCRFTLTEDRSGFVSREQQEVIWSDHQAFRPIDVKLGPDGAIYIADWYNPIIQHGEVDFRDPRRDHTHGRIWRVTWKGAGKKTPLDVAALTNAELFKLLERPDNYDRMATQQELRHRGHAITEDLALWIGTIPVTPRTEHLRLEALWCCQALRIQNNELLHQLLTATDGRVRAAATRVLSHWKHGDPDSPTHLKRLVNDPHPRVRLEAVRAISFSPNGDSEARIAHDLPPSAPSIKPEPATVELAMQASDHPTDTFLDYAIWLTARELADTWLPAFKDGSITFNHNIGHLLTAFSAVGQGAPVEFLLPTMYLETTTQEQRYQVTQLVSTSGSPQQVGALVAAAVTQADAGVWERVLSATRSRRNFTPVGIADLTAAAANFKSDSVRHVALRAIGQWKLPAHVEQLQNVASDATAPLEDRLSACDGLALAGGKLSEDALNQIARGKQTPLAVRVRATSRLTGLKPGRAAAIAVQMFSNMPADQSLDTLISGFMVVKNGDRILAAAVQGTQIENRIALELLRIVRQSGRAAPELEAALKSAGSIASRKAMTVDARLRILAMAEKDVTAAEGEVVFRNEKLGCLKCHAIGGAGGKVGPDMVSLGGSARPDYLLESLLNPNAKVKENYHTIVIATVEGKIVSGVQVKKSQTETVVRTATGELVTVAQHDIDDIGQGVSLMPEGLVDTLTDREIAALVRFMSELGRTPEYSISRRQLARTWEIMQPTPEAALRLRRTSYASAATDDPAYTWSTAFSTVSGALPVKAVPAVSVRNRSAAGARGVGFARCYLQVETSGNVQLRLNEIPGLKMRFDDRPIDLNGNIEVQVAPGVHRVTFSVDGSQRSEPLEFELLNDGTTAVASFAN